jgi:Rrf2 family iron-sulfur cluster assembly transcriptional regulator
MSMIFSRQCDYALQAVLYLALRPEGEMTPIRELADRLEIPYHFLGKILQKLTKKGLLRSMKGPNGGFSLGVPARNITLFRVVEAVDGVEFTSSCVMGFRDCSGESPCAVHETWAGLRQGISAMLAERNVAELALGMKKEEYLSHGR